MKRRELLCRLGAGAAAAGGLGTLPVAFAGPGEQATTAARRGLPALKITDVQTILTAPNGIRLVVVKVMTSEPGLYGLGCATFTQRAYVVETAIEKYLKPFLIGRNPDEIEDIWQSSYVSSYWRNGPVLFNAMSGVDMALWDIKGKRANMPVYQLLGGKCRTAAELYYHASGSRLRGGGGQGPPRHGAGLPPRARRRSASPACRPTEHAAPDPPQRRPTDVGPDQPRSRCGNPPPYVRTVPKLFEHLRLKLGDEVELLHDVHERVSLPQAVQLCKDLEPYRLFFLEDPLPPEEIGHFTLLRQQTSTPLAMGELFNTQQEYVPLIANRLIDFIRIHISQIGGLSVARKVAAMAEFFGVRTAWHGPGDTSPVGHAASLALELASYNFGIHEGYVFPPETREVFPGCPEVRNGYLWATEAPGLGIDIDEKLAAKFPFPSGDTFDHSWGETRRRDGTVIRP